MRADRWSSWVRRLPPWRRRALIAAVLVVSYGCVYLLVVGLSALVFGLADWTSPIGPLIGSAIGTYLVTRYRARTMGGTAQAEEFQRALRSGRVPVDVDPAEWRRSAAGERRLVRGSLVGVAGVVVVLVVCLLALAAWTGDPGWGAASLVSGLLLAVLGAAAWGARRNGRKLDRLLVQLPTEGAEEAGVGSSG